MNKNLLIPIMVPVVIVLIFAGIKLTQHKSAPPVPVAPPVLATPEQAANTIRQNELSRYGSLPQPLTYQCTSKDDEGRTFSCTKSIKSPDPSVPPVVVSSYDVTCDGQTCTWK